MQQHQTATILLEGFMVNTLIGVYDEERKNKQSLLLDISIETAASAAIESDNIEHTLNYHEWSIAMRQAVGKQSFYLLEALGDFILKHLHTYDGRVLSAEVTIRKFNVVEQCASCGMRMQRCFKIQ